MITWSYTRLSDWLQCPYKFQQVHILKTVPRVETEAMREGTRLHKILEDAINTDACTLPPELAVNQATVDKFRSLGAVGELQLGVRRDWTPCDFDAPDVWGRGKLDVTGTALALGIIADWKTGSTKNKKYMKEDELKLHSLLLKAHMPELTMISAFYVYTKDGSFWPEHGKPYKFVDFPGERAKVDALMDRLEYAVKSDKCTTRKNTLCPWCPVTHCRHYKPRTLTNG